MSSQQRMPQPALTKSPANRVSVLWVALFAVACINSMGGRDDQERIAGLYILESVDGVAIPAPVRAQQGCNRTVEKAIFTISVGGPDVAPTYSWTISIKVDCDPLPSGVSQGEDDVGAWRFQSSTRLAFRSLKDQGVYGGALEEAPGDSPAISFAYDGNTYRFVRLMRWDDPQGVVYVKFTDQFGQPVPGVRLVYTFANGLEGGGTTPDSGEYGASGVVGECKITMTPPAGYAIPASQPNPISVTVVKDEALHINVGLTKL